jgi:hypothetical protein
LPTQVEGNGIDLAVFYRLVVVWLSLGAGSFLSPRRCEIYQTAILVRAQTLFVHQIRRAADYFSAPFYFYGFFRKAGVFKRILHFKMVLFIRNASDVALCASVLPSILGFTRFMQFMEIAFSTRSSRSGFFPLRCSMNPLTLRPDNVRKDTTVKKSIICSNLM